MEDFEQKIKDVLFDKEESDDEVYEAIFSEILDAVRSGTYPIFMSRVSRDPRDEVGVGRGGEKGRAA